MFGMAGVATLLRMLTGKLIELLRRTFVTHAAGRCQFFTHRHEAWGVGVDMTGQTIGELLPMRQFMTIAAFGHQLFPIPLFRVVGVKYLMALPAVESMQTAIRLKPIEMRNMTLDALAHGQGFWLNGIQLRDRCSLGRSSLAKPSQAADHYYICDK